MRDRRKQLWFFRVCPILPYDIVAPRVMILVVIVDSPIVSLDEASVDLAPRLAVFFS